MSRRPWVLLTMFVLVIAIAPAVRAGEEVKGHFSFGPSFPSGAGGDVLESGWALHGGATWFQPAKPFGIRLDFGVDWWNMKRSALDQIDTEPSTPSIQPPDNGYARSWSGTANVFWDARTQGTVGFYVTGGVGIYYLSWDLSEYGYGTGYWCDWWTGYCYGGPTYGEYLVESGSKWAWGLNVGIGISFKTQEGEVFVEGDYHWLDTENSAEYIPVTVGYRW